MTAVDVDALAKLRDEIRDELAGWPIGNGYYSTDIGTDDAGELADFLLDGSLAPILAEVRRGRALREDVEGLAQQLEANFEHGDSVHRLARNMISRSLRAVLAAEDPT